MPTPTGSIPDGLGVLGLHLGITEADAFLFLRSGDVSGQLDAYLRYQDGSSVPLFKANTKGLYDGVDTPAPNVGTTGDYYIQYGESPKFFGPKGSGWGAGVSLVGPQGLQGIPAEGSELIISHVDGNADAVNGARHLAYNPLNLFLPSGYSNGFYGYVESKTPGTVKLVIPSGFNVTYSNLPVGNSGRPVINRRYGKLYYEITDLGNVNISGDYVYTNKSWHPTDAGDSLWGLWQAGATLNDGGHAWAPTEFNDIVYPSNQTYRWEALFGSQKNARFAYEPLLNGDNGSDILTFTPILTGDSEFKNSWGYNLRRVAGASKTIRLKNHTGDVVPTAPCRIFLAVKHLTTSPIATQQLLSISNNSTYAGGENITEGLFWLDFYRYQFTTAQTFGSYGTKGGYNENNTSGQLLTLNISSSGSTEIYSNGNMITSAMPSSGINFQFLEIDCGVPLNIGGFALITGAPGNLTTEMDVMRDFFFNTGTPPIS